MRLRCLLIFYLLAFFLPSLQAQRLELKFTDPFKENPLPNNNVVDIEQDSLGRIWIGTQNGLFRYNGTHLEHFYHDPRDNSSIMDNDIHDLLTDSRGRLWVGTSNGLSLYNYEFDNFLPVVDESHPTGLEGININSLEEGFNEEIYFSSGAVLYHLAGDSLRLESVYTIAETTIHDFTFENPDRVWIGGDGNTGLVGLNLTDGSETIYTSDPDDPTSLGANEIRSLSVHKHKLWIATFGAGMNAFDLGDKTFKRYPTYDEYDIYKTKSYVDNDGNLWAVDLTGLKLYDEEIDFFHGYFGYDHNTFKPDLSNIFQDRQGNYWTSHTPGGVNLSTVPRGFRSYNIHAENYWHLSDNNITAIGADPDGNWWFGNFHNGIDIFEWESERMITLSHEADDPNSLGRGTTLQIFTDSQDRVWVGSYLGGLQQYLPKSRTFKSYRYDPEHEKGPSGNDIRAIKEDAGGNLWIAVHGAGVNKFDPKTETFTYYNQVNNNLSNNWVYTVIVDREQNVWAASAYGLSFLQTGESQFKNYHSAVNNSNTISDNRVYSLLESSEGTIWAGTSNGLCKYREDTDDFERIDLGGPKPIVSIQEDDLGYIWCAYEKGLVRYNVSQKTYHIFSQEDGIQPGAFNTNATYFNETERYLFFGGTEGVNYFKGRDIKFNTTPPKVTFSDFRLFNRSVAPLSKGKILQSHISVAEKVTLNHDQNVITLEFFADNYINLEKNEFMYKMEGFDRDWILAGRRNTAIYTNLNPGEYRFLVKAGNNDGVWSTEPASLHILVTPPLWQTTWFRLLVGIAVLSAIYGVYTIRTRQLTQQKKLLEQVVKQRTLELANKNTELQKSNEAKDMMISIIGHDLRGPFGRILGFSDVLQSHYDTLTPEERIQSVQRINASSRVIYNLLDNLLKWIRSQGGFVKYHPDEVNIFILIRESLSLFTNNFEEKEIRSKFEQEGQQLLVKADVEMTKTILRNLISNALKFTETGGAIKIQVNVLDRYAEVMVSDTGIGMDQGVLSTIFSAEKSSRTGTGGEAGHSIGLLLCKKFTELNGGQISVESKENVGSTFRFTLPLV